MFDLVIKNGTLYDGLGTKRFKSNIGITGNKIKVITKDNIKGKVEIDAKNKSVMPGFIDPHVHEELTVLQDGTFEAFLRQGVTTTVNGNCGHSISCGEETLVLEYMKKNGLISEKGINKILSKPQNRWNNMQSYLEVVNKTDKKINMGFLLGHGTIRWVVMKGAHNRKPTVEELERMKDLVKKGMEQGALGLSTGLSYIPGKFATTEEIIELCKVVAEFGGVYATHARYPIGIYESTLEAIEIGRKSGVNVQVSHLMPTSIESYEAVKKAREEGIVINIDTIPKSSGHIKRIDTLYLSIAAQSVPLFGLSRAELEKALIDERRESALDAIRFRDQLSVIRTGDSEIEGRLIKDIARERGQDPDDVLVEFLLEGGDEFSFFQGGMNREDFSGAPYPEEIANNPYVSVGTDRIMGEVEDPFTWYELFRKGGFPTFFKQLKDSDIKTEEIVRRLTSMVCEMFSIDKRGVLEEGYIADIIVLDLDKFDYPDEKTIDYNKPLTYASGIENVIVSGQMALHNGELTDIFSGEIIK